MTRKIGKSKSSKNRIARKPGNGKNEIDELMSAAPLVSSATIAKTPDLLSDPEWVAEDVKMQIAEDMRRALREARVSQAEVARRLGMRRQQLSRMLSEPSNLTIESMAKFFSGIGWQLVIRGIRRDEAAPIVPFRSLPAVRKTVGPASRLDKRVVEKRQSRRSSAGPSTRTKIQS
jgi:DNA-binding phage protein